jgi:RimJ/RimL family protein N-acetyltransferase
MKAVPTLRGQRLLLRPWQPEDLDAAVAWNNDIVSLRWGDADRRDLPYRPWTRDEIERVYRSVSSRGYAFIARLGRKRVGEFILTFNGPHPLTSRIDLVVAPGHRRQGLGREGVALCAEFAFSSLGFSRLYAYVDPQSLASSRLFRSLGFRRDLREEEGPLVLTNTSAALRRLSGWLSEARPPLPAQS